MLQLGVNQAGIVRWTSASVELAQFIGSRQKGHFQLGRLKPELLQVRIGIIQDELIYLSEQEAAPQSVNFFLIGPGGYRPRQPPKLVCGVEENVKTFGP